MDRGSYSNEPSHGVLRPILGVVSVAVLLALLFLLGGPASPPKISSPGSQADATLTPAAAEPADFPVPPPAPAPPPANRLEADTAGKTRQLEETLASLLRQNSNLLARIDPAGGAQAARRPAEPERENVENGCLRAGVWRNTNPNPGPGLVSQLAISGRPTDYTIRFWFVSPEGEVESPELQLRQAATLDPSSRIPPYWRAVAEWDTPPFKRAFFLVFGRELTLDYVCINTESTDQSFIQSPGMRPL